MIKLANFFLHRYTHEDYIVFSHAKLTLNFCLITSLFSAMYIVIASMIGFEESVFTMSSLSVLFLGLAFLIRQGISLQIISSLYLLLSFAAAVFLVNHSGKIYSSILPWLSFIPLVALLLQNKTSSFIWLIVCFITVFAFAFLQQDISHIPVKYEKRFEPWFFAVVYNGLTGIILSLSMIFQRAKDSVLRTLEQKNQLISSINVELKNKNAEIISQNEELQQQKEEITAQREFIESKNRELLLVQDELNSLIEKLTITQDTLADREAEYKSILDSIYNTQLLVGELDLQGRIIRINSAALKFFQLKEQDLLGEKMEDLGQKIDLRIQEDIEYSEFIKEICKGNSSYHEAMALIGAKEYWLKENYFAVLDKKGNPLKIMIISQDISQIKHQQKEIEALNKNLKTKLSKIKKQNDLLEIQQKKIESINNELSFSNEEIKNINQNLEQHVAERTKNLELQNKQLKEYAYINAHLLRGPLCSILGLVQLLERQDPQDNASILLHMKKSSEELQQVVNKITSAIEKGAHFDRNLIYKN